MQFINVKELSRSPSKYVKIANEEDDIVITKNGHPNALLTKISNEELEDFILAKHFNLEREFAKAKREHANGKTKNIHELIKAVTNEV